jgi:hypothetical protein
MEKLRIVIGGFIGLFPTGGATLDYIQYPLGFHLLGHDVYYIEDTNLYPIYQKEGDAWNDASTCVDYLKQTMEHFSLSDRWAYRDVASGNCFGMPLEKVLEICRTADVFLNISCSTHLRDEYLKIPKRILLDSDPMFTQIQYHNELLTASEHSTIEMIHNHNYLFSFGENIGNDDCRIPSCEMKWHSTRQPVCLDLWNHGQLDNAYNFTSVMNWAGRKKLVYANEEWGQKDLEFMKYLQLPKLARESSFEVVINPPLHSESNFNPDEITGAGWKVMKPETTVANFHDYKKFIKSSFAEFSVAKETYVKSKSGWFSCRSACYLAAGRPVIAQETGWSKFIPAGRGVFAFDDMQSAVDAVAEINRSYSAHRTAAKEIAQEYFDSNAVLTQMLQKLN